MTEEYDNHNGKYRDWKGSVGTAHAGALVVLAIPEPRCMFGLSPEQARCLASILKVAADTAEVKEPSKP